MMVECISEQKDWQRDMRRRADAIYQQYNLDDPEVDLPEVEVDVEGVDEVEMQEQEMDALLENMPTSPAKSVHSFKDEDDADDLFEQFMGEDMDMS